MDDAAGLDESQQAEKIFFAYLTKAYAVYFAGSDNFESMEEALMGNFGIKNLTTDRKNNSMIKEVERLTKEHSALEKELVSLSDSEVLKLLL